MIYTCQTCPLNNMSPLFSFVLEDDSETRETWSSTRGTGHHTLRKHALLSCHPQLQPPDSPKPEFLLFTLRVGEGLYNIKTVTLPQWSRTWEATGIGTLKLCTWGRGTLVPGGLPMPGLDVSL